MTKSDRMRMAAPCPRQPPHPSPPACSQMRLAVRIDATNPLHHLWNNKGIWWCNLTIHDGTHRAQRIRFSLKTKDSDVAIRKRDQLLQHLS